MPIQAVKGTKDILPDEIGAWHRIEGTARALFALYGYREIRTPIFESTELFARGIGTETYTFEDRDGGSITLRPEATAGIVRSVIEHNLINNDPALKVFTFGPMFRRERPQKGRYRQFHQVNVEVFGITSPSVDVEVIEMSLAYIEGCGLTSYELILNSVGDAKCRPAYVETLRTALRAQASKVVRT
jgi:histidyl-tRNA synthetase